MASTSTVYDVSIRYALDDRASAAMERLGQTAERTEKHVGGLGEGLRTVAELFLAREAFHKGKELFVDLNSEMEQMKISMAAITSYNLGDTFERAAEKTDKLIVGWQQFSKQTTLTTSQFVKFGSQVEGAVLNAGGKFKDLDEIVRKGAVVGGVLSAGHAGGLDYVSLELREALQGNVRKTQMFNQQLLGPYMKKLGLEMDSLNTMESGKRLEIIKGALNDPAWNSAIDKQKNSWLGVTSTLKDTIEILGRETGEKLFGQLKGQIGGLNRWLDAHPKLLSEWSTKVSDALAKGFGYVKTVFEFIVEHKDLILTLARAWATSKVLGAFGGGSGLLSTFAGGGSLGGSAGGTAGILQNLMGITQRGAFGGMQYNAVANNGISPQRIFTGMLVGQALDSMTGNLGKTNTALMSFEGALAGLPGPLGLIGSALLAFHSALKYVAEKIDERHKERLVSEADFGAGKSHLLGTHTDAGAAFNFVKEVGAITRDGQLDKTKFQMQLERLAGSSDDAQKNLKSVPNMVKSAMALFEALGPEEIKRRLHQYDANKGVDAETGAKKDPTKVSVTIHKIEVPAADPDRFVHALVRKFDQVARNPVAARSQLRGGF